MSEIHIQLILILSKKHIFDYQQYNISGKIFLQINTGFPGFTVDLYLLLSFIFRSYNSFIILKLLSSFLIIQPPNLPLNGEHFLLFFIIISDKCSSHISSIQASIPFNNSTPAGGESGGLIHREVLLLSSVGRLCVESMGFRKTRELPDGDPVT